MTGEAITSLEPSRLAEFPVRSESPFYPNIANNRLLFHGTPSEEILNDIIARGLRPPNMSGPSSSTLARRISYSDDSRYSGHYGFIIGFEPEPSELSNCPPQYARERSLSMGLTNLPPERAVFILAGSSNLPRVLFEQIRETVTTYFAAAFNQNVLFSRLGHLVEKAEEELSEHATMLHETEPSQVHRLAQELVWNELCGYTTHREEDINFYARIISEIKAKQTITSTDQLSTVLKTQLSTSGFNKASFLNNLKFLSTISEINGLGFENLHYQFYGNIESVSTWLTDLPAADHPPRQVSQNAPQTGIRNLLHKIQTLTKNRID